MFKTYTSEVEVTAIRIEGDLRNLCDIIKRISPEAHPMWKMPGGYHPNKEPNAVMFRDHRGDWLEAEIGDYLVKHDKGAMRVEGYVFDAFFHLA